MRIHHYLRIALFFMVFWLSCKKEPKWNLEKILPNVKTEKVEEIKASDVIAVGNIVHNAGLKIIRSGFCVSIHRDSCTLEDARTYDYVFSSGKQQGGYGSISMRVDGLEENTSYYVRAFAINEKGTAYGEIISFKTKRFARVVTDTVVDIKQFTAIASGHVENDNGYAVTERGICWGTDSNLSVEQSAKVQMGKGLGSYSAQLTSLPSATKIFYKAYALNDGGASYGKLKVFTTLDLSKATVITGEPINVTSDQAECEGIVIHDGGNFVFSRGICYSTSPNPTKAHATINSGTGTGTFSVSLKGLSYVTSYYYKAYADNALGTEYGEEKTFTTEPDTPFVKTVSASNTGYTQFTIGGNVLSEGGVPVTDRGVCWSTVSNPTINNFKITVGSGLGLFSRTITGLTPNTKYYYRAYATNGIGTHYGDEYSVTTLALEVPKITQTLAVSAITDKSGNSGGVSITDGGSAVTSKGVCWNTTGNPKITDSKTIDGSGTSNFNSSLTALKPKTTYYVAAYATNSVGTGYGNTVTFTTLSIDPTVSTSSVSVIKSSSFTAGGSVTSDGGYSVTSKGICWSTSPGPDINSSKTNNGTGLGAFGSAASGLQPNTKYYYRAYAINSGGGIGYGIESSVITLPLSSPTVVTIAPNNITATTASSGGTTIDDGGSAITSKGVCWNTTGNPTISDAKTNNGNGNTDFISFIQPLTVGITYYVRAYATNNIGTGYGSTFSFIPSLTAPVLNSPINSATIGTYFYLKWSCVTGATSYELQMSTSSSFTGTLRSLPISPGGWLYTTGYHSGTQGSTCSGSVVTSDMMQTTSTAGPGTYTFYWRVRAKTASTTGPWSTTGSFKFVK
jgi:hypothetical protein